MSGESVVASRSQSLESETSFVTICVLEALITISSFSGRKSPAQQSNLLQVFCGSKSRSSFSGLQLKIKNRKNIYLANLKRSS